MAAQSGFDTGIHFPELIAAIEFASLITQRELGGRSAQWLKRRYQAEAA